METTAFHLPASLRIPVHCVLYVPQGDRQGPGMIHNLSIERCHIESPVEVCPGMTLALYLILPSGSQHVAVEHAMVTWARRGECGIRIQHLQRAEADRLRAFLRTHAAEHDSSRSTVAPP